MIGDGLFFVHVPKTAGSSFRIAAEGYFGKNNTFFDYGQDSSDTNKHIVELEYRKNDRLAVGVLLAQRAQFLSGHVNYAKYGQFFKAKNIVTFVRDPLQQVKSHYEHFTRHYGYSEDFETFVSKPQFSNLQSKYLKGVNVESLGFVGLTEEYEESLGLMNKYYGFDIDFLSLNKNSGKSGGHYELTSAEEKLIKKFNKDDFKLYELCKNRYERQKKAITQGIPFVRSTVLPNLPAASGKDINAWVMCYESEDAQQVTVECNGKVMASLVASEFRPVAFLGNYHRHGYVGLSYAIPKDVQDGDVLIFRAKLTGEEIFRHVVSK